VEASSHINFKNAIVHATEGDTMLSLKKVVPVRLLKNKFFEEVQDAENQGAESDILREILGKGRAKKGMFEGDLEEGELEIGQASALISDILPAASIVKNIYREFGLAIANPVKKI
jgi:enoyl-[acyl-carrier protein] reductase II